MLRQILALVLMLPMAACASHPPLVEAHQGAPLAPGLFRLARFAPDPAAGLTTAEQRVSDALQMRGFRPAAEDQPADFLVQVSVADRPKVTQAFLAGDAVTPLQAQPSKSLGALFSKGAYDVRVQMLDGRTGVAAYYARLTAAYRKPTPAALPALVSAALEPLKLR